MAAQDNTLIETCAAFTQLDAEILAYEKAYAPREDEPAEPPPHPRDGELDSLLDELCATRATSLDGISARLQALLHWAPYLIKEWQRGGYDRRMCAALLRDLQDMLHQEPQSDQRNSEEVDYASRGFGALGSS